MVAGLTSANVGNDLKVRQEDGPEAVVRPYSELFSNPERRGVAEQVKRVRTPQRGGPGLKTWF